MTATLTIQFEDGSAETISLANAIEIGTDPSRPQSLEFRQTKDGKWVMTFTAGLWRGRKFQEIRVKKDSP